jgi:hypothetical protein
MGHATIEETFSRYGHLMPGARDQARVKMPPRGGSVRTRCVYSTYRAVTAR